MDLVVGLGVHHDVIGAVAIKVLIFFPLGDDDIDLFGGAEAVLDVAAGLEVLHAGLVKGAKVAGSTVHETFDTVWHPIPADDGAS